MKNGNFDLMKFDLMIILQLWFLFCFDQFYSYIILNIC